MQSLGARFIIFNLFIFIVLTSVQFNAKIRFMAVEVKDKARFGVLTTEFGVMKTTITKNIPHELFGVGGIFAKFADAFFEFFGEARVELEWLNLALIPSPSP